MQADGLIFAGFDIETTGSDFISGHAICQVGLYIPEHEFVSDVGVAPGTPYTREALEVNGFTEERMAGGPALRVVDEQLAGHITKLTEHLDGRRLVIPIGWNVAGFDMGFMRRWMPLAHGLFSYRSVDLNAVCFTLSPTKWEKWKRAAKRYASEVLEEKGWDLRPHDALFDAAQGYYAWEFLRAQVEETGANL